MTLLKVADPATANFAHPDAGQHFVAAEFRLENHGSTTWNGDGAPTVASYVTGSDGQQYGPMIASTTLGQMFTSRVVIPAGGGQVGAITFAVKDGVKTATVQIVLDRGAGPSARWAFG